MTPHQAISTFALSTLAAGKPTSVVITLIIVMIGAVMAGGLFILLIRRRLFAKDSPSDHSASVMESLRSMRDSGQISTAEYDAMRKRMVEKIKGSTVPARIVPPAQLPPGNAAPAPSPAAEAAQAAPPPVPAPAAPSPPTPPAPPPARAVARPGYDLTGRPLPIPPLALWQVLVSLGAVLLSLGLCVDLLASLGAGRRGLLWTTSFPVSTYGAKPQVLELALVLAAGGVCMLAWVTLSRRREEPPLALCALLIGGVTILPILGHLSMALSIPAELRAGEAARIVFSRCLTEAVVACALVFVSCVMLWVSRRRVGGAE